MMKIGFGYDVHRFAEGRKLILGGVEIPNEFGLEGHSDADVLIHSICDALLGACGLGDIGVHFPDTDSAFKGIRSTILLKRVNSMVLSNGFFISNIDCTIVCQKPKLASFFPSMKMVLSDILNINKANINIKATTEENMGFTGQLLGIKAYCTALIHQEETEPKNI